MRYLQDVRRNTSQEVSASPQQDLGTVSQPYGNGAAQEAMPAQPTGEPIDITAVAPEGDARLTVAATVLDAASAVSGDGLAVGLDVDSLVADILAQSNGRPIGLLKIIGHATPGSMQIGEDVVDSDSVAAMIPVFARLRGRFAPDGRVEMHGCNFAAGEAGGHMLYVLSEIWGVPVTGGTQVQNPLIPGFEGTTITWGQDEDGFPARHIEHHPVADGQLEIFRDAYVRGLETASEIWDWVFGPDDVAEER